MAFENILPSIKMAFKEAGIPSSEISNTAVGIGMAGLEISKEKNLIKQWKHLFSSMVFSSDMHIACLGAHHSNNGAILSIGTGTAFCEINDFSFTVKSGWGFPLADLGSGAWLGLCCF